MYKRYPVLYPWFLVNYHSRKALTSWIMMHTDYEIYLGNKMLSNTVQLKIQFHIWTISSSIKPPHLLNIALLPGYKHAMSLYPGKCIPITLIIYLLQISTDIILPPNFQPITWALPLCFFPEEACVLFFHLPSVQHASPTAINVT